MWFLWYDLIVTCLYIGSVLVGRHLVQRTYPARTGYVVMTKAGFCTAFLSSVWSNFDKAPLWGKIVNILLFSLTLPISLIITLPIACKEWWRMRRIGREEGKEALYFVRYGETSIHHIPMEIVEKGPGCYYIPEHLVLPDPL